MPKHIENIEIKNFKSINNVILNNCTRINLFIGKPNVGKSNLLEALSIFSLTHCELDTNKKLRNYIRLENETELFFDGNIDKTIEIKTNIANCYISRTKVLKSDISNEMVWDGTMQLSINIQSNDNKLIQQLTTDEKLNVKNVYKNSSFFAVKRYLFTPNIKYKKTRSTFLIPPFGVNLLNVIELNKKLKNELIEIFLEYGLQLVFDKASETLKIMKTNRDKELFLLPYNSIADTLQRIIFFKSAITSNENAILLFEEPEAHSFPPYIVHITQEIINSASNQFFISTHSPYIVNDFLENCREDLSIFLTDYKNGETLIKKLSKDEIFDIYQYGVDLFTNNESYL